MGSSSSGSNRSLTINKAKRDDFIRVYRTPVLFLLVFSVTWFSIFYYRLSTDVPYMEYHESAAAWISCLLTNHSPVDVMHASTICGANQGLVPHYFAQFMIGIVVIGTNHFYAIVYGMNVCMPSTIYNYASLYRVYLCVSILIQSRITVLAIYNK